MGDYECVASMNVIPQPQSEGTALDNYLWDRLASLNDYPLLYVLH